jgi:hypothetical protein
LRRNPEVTVRQSEGLSLASGMGKNITEVKSFFGLFGKVMEENNLLNQPGKIFNVDESGLQLHEKGGEKIIALKGSNTVPQITSGEKDGAITAGIGIL